MDNALMPLFVLLYTRAPVNADMLWKM